MAMKLTLQPTTSIAADGRGVVNYVGPWADCRAALAYFRVEGTGGYSFVAWKPGAELADAPERETIAADADAAAWAEKEAELIAAGKLISLDATLRARNGGIGELSIETDSARDLMRKIMDALGAQGSRSWSFGVAEIPRSILEDETPETQDHINAWLAAPAPLRARFLYLNANTGYNAALTDAEILIARKFLLGQDTVYSYAPSVTLTISGASSEPADLPDNGAASQPPNGAFPGWTGAWRVVSSGSVLTDDGTYDAAVTWQGA